MLVARARHVTFAPCGLAAAVFEFLAVRRLAQQAAYPVPEVVVASTGHFRAIGLVYGFMAASVALFSAYQGWSRAVPPHLASAGATVLGATVLCVTFVLWPPIWSRKPVSG